MGIAAVITNILAVFGVGSLIVLGATNRATLAWWIGMIGASIALVIGTHAIRVASNTPTKVIDEDGVRHGLGGPGPFVVLGFGVLVFVVGGVVAAILVKRIRRVRS